MASRSIWTENVPCPRSHEVSVRLQIWSKGGDQVHATAHATAEEALRQWRATLGKSVSVLTSGQEPSLRRPTKWEEAATPNKLLASPAFAQMFSHAVNTRPLPDDLESDYLAVVSPARQAVPLPAAPTIPPPSPALPQDAAGILAGRRLPGWFLALPVSDLALSPSLQGELARLGVARVRDVSSVPAAALNGRADDLVAALERARAKAARARLRLSRLGRLARARERRMAMLPGTPAAPVIEESLASLNDHQREALVRCIGLYGRAESLAAIGRDLSVTRERVRQVVARALDLCDESHGWPTALAAHFARTSITPPAFQAFAGAAWAHGLRPQSVERLYRLLVRWGAGRISAPRFPR